MTEEEREELETKIANAAGEWLEAVQELDSPADQLLCFRGIVDDFLDLAEDTDIHDVATMTHDALESATNLKLLSERSAFDEAISIILRNKENLDPDDGPQGRHTALCRVQEELEKMKP